MRVVMRKEWKEEFATKIEEIDCQHKKLFDLIDELLGLVEKNVNAYDKRDLDRLIRDLYAYAEYHFSFEEEYMKKNNYSEYQEHCDIHKKFVDKLDGFVMIGEEEINLRLLMEMLEYFTGWIVSHIFLEDKKYSKEILDIR